MRIGIVTDSACDLPQAYVRENNVEILPISLRFGDQLFRDVRDPEATKAFYQRYLANAELDAETQPLSTEEIAEIFLSDLVLKYDRALVMTVASSRSPIFENATKASFKILKDYRKVRESKGIEGSFALRVMDSKTLFTGQAVLIHETVRMMREEGLAFEKLRPAVEALTDHVYGYLVPNDLAFIYHRGRQKGDRSVGWLGWKLGSALDVKPLLRVYRGETGPIGKVRGFDQAVEALFDIAREEIIRGLRAKIVCMSFAGDPGEMRKKESFQAFEQFCTEHGVETMLSVMSTTAGVNVGPGSFALGYISGEKS